LGHAFIQAFRMLTSTWRLVLAVAVCVLGAATVHAQTVVVTGATPGDSIEFVLGDAVVASATVDAMGVAVLQAPPDAIGTRQLDASIRVDDCGTSHRVLVFDRSALLPSSGTCRRTDITGVFLVQRITSLVFDLGEASPRLRVRQGEPPPEWLRDRPDVTTRSNRGPATALVLAGGAGLSEFSEFTILQCGRLNVCVADRTPRPWTASLAYWFAPFVGVEAGFIKPEALTASATTPAFQFDTRQQLGVLTMTALGGIPIGRVKVTGEFGAAYHRATVTTRQTLEERTVVVDGVPFPLAGGTQTTQTRLGGWGWLWTVGAEWWPTSPLGLYGEYGRFTLRGLDLRGGEQAYDENVTFLVGGAKLRLPTPW
jgi:hypothetical protein